MTGLPACLPLRVHRLVLEMSGHVHALAVAVVSTLYVHPEKRSDRKSKKIFPMRRMSVLTLVEDEESNEKWGGIAEDKRFYGRSPYRQISMIDRSTIELHSKSLKHLLREGAVRSNIETIQINRPAKECPFTSFVGRSKDSGTWLHIGFFACIQITQWREPCWEMDVLCNGLQESMKARKQGVLARVARSGPIETGDPIVPCSAPDFCLLCSLI